MNIVDMTPRLVHEAREGSRDAFAQLVRLHHESVRAFLCRHLPRTDVAEDVAQEVFLVAYRRIGEYRGDAQFSTWLLAIARNLALEYLRRETRRKRRDLEAALAREQAERLSGLGEDVVEHEQTLDALRGCIEDLPAESRSVVRRFYFEREPAESIAESVGKKAGTVRMTLLRIRRALGDCVRSKLQGRGADR